MKTFRPLFTFGPFIMHMNVCDVPVYTATNLNLCYIYIFDKYACSFALHIDYTCANIPLVSTVVVLVIKVDCIYMSFTISKVQ